MPEHEPQEFRACGVCGRTLLKGERAVDCLTPDGAIEPVCTLCRSQAEEAGWMRADSPQARAVPASARRRRSLRGLNLRERAARAGKRVRKPQPSEEAEAGTTPPPRRSGPRAPEREETEPQDTPERRLRLAVERFNASDQVRVVAGLTRSLGRPQVAVRELSTDPPRLEVTVAWDLSWYRWEIGLNGEDAPRRVGKGASVEELAAEEIDWNTTVDDEGRLRWREGS